MFAKNKRVVEEMDNETRNNLEGLELRELLFPEGVPDAETFIKRVADYVIQLHNEKTSYNKIV